MPFLGQDWRSPGEQWVRTTEGWEKMRMWRLKVLENLNENVVARLLKIVGEDLYNQNYGEGRCSQPYVYLTNRLTREQKMQTGIGEAMTRLDMSSAVKDIKRYNYVCKVLELLLRHKLTSLSGTGQKMVFTILEELLNQAVKTQNNLHVIQLMLDLTRAALVRGHYDHVGSSSLWGHHTDTVDRMQNSLNAIQLKERKEDGKAMLQELPDDVIREILKRLADHRDVVSVGLAEGRAMPLCQEQVCWRRLCEFHFPEQQWATVLRKGETLEALSWNKLYHRLVRRYGPRDIFEEMLNLCRHCNALYWDLHGHNFVVSENPSSIPISPAMCIELFT